MQIKPELSYMQFIAFKEYLSCLNCNETMRLDGKSVYITGKTSSRIKRMTNIRRASSNWADQLRKHAKSVKDVGACSATAAGDELSERHSG